MMDKLWEALNKLAESTGVAIEHLYTLLVQQAKVQMIWDALIVLGVLLLIALGIFVTMFFIKKYKEDDFYSEWETPAIASGVITGVLGVICVVGVIPSAIREIVQIAVNPPVWILEYVMNLIK